MSRTQPTEIARSFVYLLWCPKGQFVYATREISTRYQGYIFNRAGLLSPEIVVILFTRGLPYVRRIKNRLTCENYVANYKIFQEHRLNSRRFPGIPSWIAQTPWRLTDLLSGVDALVLSGNGISGGSLVRVLNERVAAMRRDSDHVAVSLEHRPHVLLAQQNSVEVADEYSRPNRYRVRVVRHVTYLAHHCTAHQPIRCGIHTTV